MTREGYAVMPEAAGLFHIYYAVSGGTFGSGYRLFGPYGSNDEAWAAIPDRTKPPGMEPNLSFFRQRNCFDGFDAAALKAMAVDTHTTRPVEETSHIAHDRINELDAKELRLRIWQWLMGRPMGATADELNRAFPDPANRADKQLAVMRRAGMIVYALDDAGNRIRRGTRMQRPAYVHEAIPEHLWRPVKAVKPNPMPSGDAGGQLLRFERMKQTGMSMVPGIRRLRDQVRARSIGSNALTVELTGIADWLETLFKDEMEYSDGR